MSPEDIHLIEEVEKICKDINLFEHIEAMNYPRMAGSEGERRAADYIGGKFREFGFETKVEKFYLPESSQVSKFLVPILLIFWGVLSYINIFYISGFWGFIFAFILLLCPILILILIMKLEILFKKMVDQKYKQIQATMKQIEEGKYSKEIKEERNVYVEYEGDQFDEHLYITAHYDSTTLKISMKMIKICGFLGFLCAAVYLLSYVLHYFMLLVTGNSLFHRYPIIFLIFLIGFLTFVSIILFGRAFRTNKSHGAIDNLTGTALVIELARVAQIVKPKLKITFILFPAEEVGFFGSAYHFHTHKHTFENQKMHVVSIDMIGEIAPLTLIEKIKPFFSLPMDSEFNQQIKSISEQLGVQIKLGRFMYPGSDFACWFLNGIASNWVMTPSKYIHSAQDISENVNQILLKECLKLFTGYFIEKSK